MIKIAHQMVMPNQNAKNRVLIVLLSSTTNLYWMKTAQEYPLSDANNRCNGDTLCVKDRLVSREAQICKKTISVMVLNGSPKRATCRWVSSINFWECENGGSHNCVGNKNVNHKAQCSIACNHK